MLLCIQYMAVFHLSERSPTPLLQSWKYRSQLRAQGKVSQLVSGKRLGTHWKSQHKVHQELSFAITRLHHRQEAVPKAWECLQLRVSFLLPQKVLCSGERGTGFPLQSFALASCGCPHAACSSPVLCFPRLLLIDLSSVSCHCKIQRLCSESSARVKV